MDEHVSTSQMERYRERQLRGEELFSVNRHLGSCDECRTQYNGIANTDSSALLNSMLRSDWLPSSSRSTTVSTVQPHFGRLSLTLTIALTVLVGLTVALILRSSRSRNQEPQVVVGPTESTGPLPSPAASPEASPSMAEGGTGANQGRDTAQAPRLQKTQELARVVRSEIVTLKGTPGEVAFSLLRPVGTFILDARPTLSWFPVKEATRYEVSMRPLKGTRSIFTTTTTETSYTPAAGVLDGYRNQVLQWSVTAELPNGTEVTAPGIAAPEALLVIANEASARKVEALVKQQKDEVMRAMVYANAAFLDDAERELNSHLQKHSNDPNARRMALTIKSWRSKN